METKTHKNMVVRGMDTCHSRNGLGDIYYACVAIWRRRIWLPLKIEVAHPAATAGYAMTKSLNTFCHRKQFRSNRDHVWWFCHYSLPAAAAAAAFFSTPSFCMSSRQYFLLFFYGRGKYKGQLNCEQNQVKPIFLLWTVCGSWLLGVSSFSAHPRKKEIREKKISTPCFLLP